MKSVLILSFFFFWGGVVFSLKMVHKDKNTIKNTKSQLKKTVRTKLTKLK